MKYVHCTERHDPDAGTYGDCMRACIASIMDRDSEEVPHFADGGVSADEAMSHMRDWLHHTGHAPFIAGYPGDIFLSDLLTMHAALNPDSLYVLFGGTGSGDHCVVCRGGEIIWNPAWTGGRIGQPLSNGTWQVLVVGRV